MKRTPLRRAGGLRRKKALRQRSDRKADSDRQLARARILVRAQSGGWCEAAITGVCDAAAQVVHHVQPRGRGGTHDVSNLRDLCDACHRWVHDHPTEATEKGLTR